VFSSGDLVEDLIHNFFLETGARNNKLKIYEMVDHPAARALENLTGANLMKLFPSPRIPTDKIPECQPHIKRGEHLKLYRFSPSDFKEIAAVFNGPHPHHIVVTTRACGAQSGVSVTRMRARQVAASKTTGSVLAQKSSSAVTNRCGASTCGK
jgi:Mn-containing catalase